MALVFGSPDNDTMGDAKLGAKMWRDLERMLEVGEIRPNRLEVLSGGLAAVQEGVQRIAQGTVSGMKLVVKVPDTP